MVCVFSFLFICFPKMAGYRSRSLSIIMKGERHSLVDLMGDEAPPTTDFGHPCAIKWERSINLLAILGDQCSDPTAGYYTGRQARDTLSSAPGRLRVMMMGETQRDRLRDEVNSIPPKSSHSYFYDT